MAEQYEINIDNKKIPSFSKSAIGQIKADRAALKAHINCCRSQVFKGAPECDNFSIPSKTNITKDFLSTRTFRILYNPTSGSGYCEKVFQMVKKELEAAKVKVEVVKSESLEHFNETVTQYTRIHHEGHVHLVVIGGDGSLNIAVNRLGALRKGTETFNVSFFAGGTANDFVRQFKIDPDHTGIPELLRQPGYRKVDLLRLKVFDKDDNYTYKYAIFQCGFGYPGRVLRTAEGCFYKMFFRHKYTVSAARELLKMQTDHVTVEVDGNVVLKAEEGTKFLMITTGQEVGKVFKVAPFAQLDDGLVDVVFAGSDQFGQMKTIFDEVQNGGMHVYNDLVKYFQGKTVKVQTQNNEKALINLDGEIIESHKIEIDIINDMIHVVH